MRCLKTLPLQIEGTIEVLEPPVRSSFYSYEPIDLTGIVIEIEIRGRQPVVVTYDELSVRPKWFDNRHTGIRSVDLVYRTMIGKTQVNIIEQQYARIDAVSHPTYVFPWGTPFHFGDLVVEGTFEHFGKETIPNDELTFSLQEGQILDETVTELRITASNGVYTTVPVEVTDVMTALDVTPPTKMDYVFGELTDYTGMVVTAIYNGGGFSVNVPLPDCDITPPEGSRATGRDTFPLSVSYNGFSKSFTLNIVSVVSGIGIVEPPTKTLYYGNEEIDYTGLVVGLYYNDWSYYEAVTDYDVSPSIFYDSMIDIEERKLTYTVVYNGMTAQGKLDWDGTIRTVVQFRDWCPWEYSEGYYPWLEDDRLIVYGWEDDDGNRISFPYNVQSTIVNKHDWTAFGMHPLTCHLYDIGGNEDCVWVHSCADVLGVANTHYVAYTMKFVGSDAISWTDPYANTIDLIEELFLPYCVGEWNKPFSRIGNTFGIIRGKITVEDFMPIEGIKMNEWEDFTIVVNGTFRFKDWYTFNYYSYGNSYSQEHVYDSTLDDGVHSQDIYRYAFSGGRIIINDGTYHNFAWTSRDGALLVTEYTRQYYSSFSYTLRPYNIDYGKTFTSLPPRCTLIINSSNAIDSIVERAVSSFPFLKSVQIPYDLKSEYGDIYGDELKLSLDVRLNYRASPGRDYTKYYRYELYMEPSVFDRWIPDYGIDM